MSTATNYLQSLLAEIDAGPVSVAKVCYEAGLDPSVVSRWKRGAVEPRLSSLERLSEAHDKLLAALAAKASRQLLGA
jgi:transcriptional regulator with XRE-family HTH domain